MRRVGLILLALLGLVLAAGLAPLVVGDFSGGDLSGWEPEEFSGRTAYSLVTDNGRQVLMAVSSGTASGLVKKVELELNDRPMLSWSWKIQGTLAKGNGLTKEGDDFAARVYLVFPSFFFWNTRAITYVWANRLPVGRAWPNAFTGKAVMMLAVDSGEAKAGQWVSHRRDVLADYRRLFGEDPPTLGAVALMTDSDNSKGRAKAWYGDIALSPR
ncbi:MAG: DUF3047 domain-containing protein [Desulfarculaceae bacterium]|nr:DUF3047 domain-containing protein [Desulfarculaceae bacterium]MCF8070816.1 DUF3047 domain-containing protein [Desulfarculaceae bacterium]MCF8102253.1 DUF3047 domain-containing protein [Desulfarculaceae bacterium]MCF8117685.1 DUF3047 domain-containing protein [Desulfarculaceae bacterium]